MLSFQGNVVVLVHSNEDSEDEDNELVVNSLCHHSDLILWVEGLATGFCKDVHGQVTHGEVANSNVAYNTAGRPESRADVLRLRHGRWPGSGLVCSKSKEYEQPWCGHQDLLEPLVSYGWDSASAGMLGDICHLGT